MPHTHEHEHLTSAENTEIIHRMNYLIGHLQGVRKMIENDAYCIDIVTQNLGVISALKKVNEKLMASHIDHCVVDAIKGSDAADREQKLHELHTIMQRM